MSSFAARPALALRCSQIGTQDYSPIKMPSCNYRNIFMSDRDRILYCKSFLRLAGKTQVYAPSKGDHQRTRLTHTLEVSQIARTIASALNLDSNLTEAIALGHDIGHTPFGHAGERMLHEIMSPTNDREAQVPKSTSVYKLTSSDSQQEFSKLYGFKHNLQSIRATVEDMESRGEPYGLNLCNYTLWGIAHHSSLSYKPGDVTTDFLQPLYYDKYQSYLKRKDQKAAWSFEALVVAEADEIAQMHHDLEDALRTHSISYSTMFSLVGELEKFMCDKDKSDFHQLENHHNSEEHLISSISRIVVNTLVTKIVEASQTNLSVLEADYGDSSNILSLDIDLEKNSFLNNAISYDVFDSSVNTEVVKAFHKKLSKTVLYTYDIQRTDSKGKYIIKNLFEAYYTNPQQLPDSALRNMYKSLVNSDYKDKMTDEYYRAHSSTLRLDIKEAVDAIHRKRDIASDICIMRIICDHIAGMTDNYAISEYEKLYG